MESKNKVIKISTRLTFDIYCKFYMFSLYRSRFSKKMPIILFINTVIGVGALLYTGFSFGFNRLSITLLILMILVAIFISFRMFILPRLYYKSREKYKEIDIEYCFEEEYLVTTLATEVASETGKMMYKAFYKVYEIDDFFFLYINIRQAKIIPKKDCSYDDIQAIREILESKVEKYIKYCKEK